MIIVLKGTQQFGEHGPQRGDIGEVISFSSDGFDVYFATKFQSFEGVFWVPSDRCSGPIMARSWQKDKT